MWIMCITLNEGKMSTIGEKFSKVHVNLQVCCVSEHSVVFHSLQPLGLWPARLLCPWNYPGRNIGVGCHFLLQE